MKCIVYELSNPIRSPFRIARCSSSWQFSINEKPFFHVPFDLQGEAIQDPVQTFPGILAFQIAAALEQYEENPENGYNLSIFLHDQKITTDLNLFDFFDSCEEILKDPQAFVTAAAVFFQALFIFLGKIDQEKQNYTRARIFCAWQWYNLTKISYCYTPGYLNPNIKINLADAYRSLAGLILDPYYSPSICWMANLGSWSADVQKETTLQERIFRSLYLYDLSSDSDGNGDFAGKKGSIPEDYMNSIKKTGHPCFAPGLQDTRLDLNQTRLLPLITKGLNKSEINKYIHSRLLTRYDFKTALQFSALLGLNANQTRKKDSFFISVARNIGYGFNKFCFSCLTYPFWFMFFYVIFAGFVIGLGAILGDKVIPPDYHVWLNLGELFILLLPTLFILLPAGKDLTGYLLLPRLTGGIVVGYFALIFQNDPDGLSNIIWNSTIQNSLPIDPIIKVCLIWLLVILLGWMYLIFDIRPMVQDWKLAGKRASFTIFIAVIVSSLLGLIAVAATTALTVFSKAAVCGAAAHVQSQPFLGPIGWVDPKQYLVYVPLALLAGLVTQFIFEDKPLTAPVWSMEQPS